jgi:UDP-glucose 4-epimerase
MHVLLTGGTGQLGRFIADALLRSGHDLTFLGRTPPPDGQGGFLQWDLSSDNVALPAADALVHCALEHVPGRYRGGEGDDPQGFWDRNAEGTQRLFIAAKAAGIGHCIFLSSRAVYTDNKRWEVLTEAAEAKPEELYGIVKLAGEVALEQLSGDGMLGTALRVTGVYGIPPGLTTHKWSDLFRNFEDGQLLPSRVATEVHGEDLAAAVETALARDPARTDAFEVYNVSDLLLDRHDLLGLYAKARGLDIKLPHRADGPVGVMECGKLKVLGWEPGGERRLEDFVREAAALKDAGQ